MYQDEWSGVLEEIRPLVNVLEYTESAKLNLCRQFDYLKDCIYAFYEQIQVECIHLANIVVVTHLIVGAKKFQDFTGRLVQIATQAIVIGDAVSSKQSMYFAKSRVIVRRKYAMLEFAVARLKAIDECVVAIHFAARPKLLLCAIAGSDLGSAGIRNFALFLRAGYSCWDYVDCAPLLQAAWGGTVF